MFPQHLPDEVHYGLVVFGYEDSLISPSYFGDYRLFLLRRGLGQGEIHAEGRSFAGLAVNVDVAVVLRHDAVDRGEAEPRPFPDFLRGEERIEYALPCSLIHSGACVRNGDHGVLPGYPEPVGFQVIAVHFHDTRLDGECAAFSHGVTGVADKVEEDLVYFGGVREDRRVRPGKYQPEIYVFGKEPSQ